MGYEVFRRRRLMAVQVTQRPLICTKRLCRDAAEGGSGGKGEVAAKGGVTSPYSRMSEIIHELICPHCQGGVVVHANELNCRIFRHGVFFNGEPIPPHAPQTECERLVAENRIYGCGKPFRVVQQDGKETAIACDYI